MEEKRRLSRPERWAHFRFSVVGPLLAAPPGPGRLRAALEKLADNEWIHPITGRPVRFAFSTIERWYHQARRAQSSPVDALRRRTRKDAGRHKAIGEDLARALRTQYDQHAGWSYRLHYDNLAARARTEPELGPLPSYATVRRFMKARGLIKKRRLPDTPGGRRAKKRLEAREVRSFEVAYTHALWLMRSAALCGESEPEAHEWGAAA